MRQVLGFVTLGLAATCAAADPSTYSEEQVKRHYLNCDHVSSKRVLDMHESSHCVKVAERLLQHHFRGDLDGLLAWWRTERDRYRASVTPPPRASL